MGKRSRYVVPPPASQKILLTQTVSLNPLQAGDRESSENRLLIVSELIRHHRVPTSTVWLDVGKTGTEQDPKSRGLPGTVLRALRVLQGEPRTGANPCQ